MATTSKVSGEHETNNGSIEMNKTKRASFKKQQVEVFFRGVIIKFFVLKRNTLQFINKTSNQIKTLLKK
ncbi:MAG: hypothetical protein AUK33_02210 [Flavobacteriaceae bacterium CG2_30_34_30]|nr:MAG: hypothetical protein AUK33_02210 [Flavobacteriaceae bacterium CG2_30_34_30]